jgi:hypothetical protein
MQTTQSTHNPFNRSRASHRQRPEPSCDTVTLTTDALFLIQRTSIYNHRTGEHNSYYRVVPIDSRRPCVCGLTSFPEAVKVVARLEREATGTTRTGMAGGRL